jgi:hypothetical protein
VPRVDDNDGAGEAPRTLWQRVKALILKPGPDPDRPHLPVAPEPTLEDLEQADKRLEERERMIGLAIAPLAAVLAFVLVADLSSKNPPAPNPAHVTIYPALELILLALSVAILAAAWFHKRLYLGVAIALYGLAIFNLHYWGFGVPFVMVGAWFMVRAYRANKAVKDAGGGPGGPVASAGDAPPSPNKRYTPPTAKKKPTPKPE